jgi:methylenetetrahydrofolate reductase (NADPH)
VVTLRNTAQTVFSNVPVEVPLSLMMTASGAWMRRSISPRCWQDSDTVSARTSLPAWRATTHTSRRVWPHRVDYLFVVAADLCQAVGRFTDSGATLSDPFASTGVGGYPEGHASLNQTLIDEALARKGSHATYVVSQMCFGSSATSTWAHQIGERGVTLPVHVGLPGAVTRHKLARIFATVGLGPYTRYLMKQNSLLLRFFLPGGYGPDRLISALGPHLADGDSNLAGFHFFTFNEVARTEAWRQALLHRLRSVTT